MTNRLEGRRIVVTGAASGIGAAIARRFAAEGAQLALFDRDPIASRATSMIVDVADRASVDAAVARAVEALGGIDGVVNAAGIGVIAAFADTDEATWQGALDVNLSGPYRVCHAALQHLLADGTVERPATIVNISSAAALQPLLRRSAYAASKGGLISFTKVLAMELAPTVRANVLVPGAVDTPMVAGSFTGAALDAVVARYAMKRLGTADEIADAALFLTSDESAFVTGSTLSVDGGRIYH
ncbi:MAG: SDR family NAD(P)-dependent oxidoreductase [Acidimicrobiia bacterium]